MRIKIPTYSQFISYKLKKENKLQERLECLSIKVFGTQKPQYTYH